MSQTRILMKDGGGVEFYVHKVGDWTYPNYPAYSDGNYQEFLEKVRNMEIRSDDVVMAGYLKSGNHWAYEMINMIMRQTTEYIPEEFPLTILDKKTLEEVDALQNQCSPRFLHSHLNIEKDMPKQLVVKKPKIFYVVRNFKDMAVSWHSFASILNSYLTYKGQWEHFLQMELQGQILYGGLFNHVKSAENFKNSNPDVPFHILYYEKLKENLVEEIRKVCHFLNKPDDHAEEIARKLNFDAMKTSLTKVKNWEKLICYPGTPGLFRKGVVGDWRNHFSQQESDLADKYFLDHVADTSIGQQLRPYMGL